MGGGHGMSLEAMALLIAAGFLVTVVALVFVFGGFFAERRLRDRLEDLDTALDELFASDGAMLLHAACYPHENVWPMIPAGAALDELIETEPLKA